MIISKKPNPNNTATKAARIIGLGNYISRPELKSGLEKCSHFGARGFICDDLGSQIKEMISLAECAVRSKDPIVHYVLSWPSGEHPNPSQIDEAVTIFLNELGLVDHQVFYGLHIDTGNDHVHIMINRVHPETERPILPENGFDIPAGLRAIARIEHAQGWKPEARAVYAVDKDGKVVKRETAAKEIKPGSRRRSRELLHGEKSAERIAQEVAGPLIEKAKSWRELHDLLAAQNMRYERKGSGALVFVGDIAIKASNVNRSASLSAMQRGLGPFEPASQEIPNVYACHTLQSHTDEVGKRTGHRMRNLSECRLATLGEHKSAGVLQIDGRPSRRLSEGVRRDTHRRGIGRAPEPLKSHQPGWKEYIAARDARRADKARTVTLMQQRHADERKQIIADQKDERKRLLAGNWRGRGVARNILISQIALQQAIQRAVLMERHKQERGLLRERFPPLPYYKEWCNPGIVGRKTEEARETTPEAYSAHNVPKLSKVLKGLAAHADPRTSYVTYLSEGRELFRDTGKRVDLIEQQDEAAIAAALAIARQKFGYSLTLQGSPATKRRMVEVAANMGMQVVFTEPALETLRKDLVNKRVLEEKAIREAELAAKKAAAARSRYAPDRVRPPSSVPVPVKPSRTPAPEPERKELPPMVVRALEKNMAKHKALLEGTEPTGQAPAPTQAPAPHILPVDSVEADRAAVMAEAKVIGKPVQQAEAGKTYEGRIVYQTPHHVLQDFGRTLVLHRVAQLSDPVQPKQTIRQEIRYSAEGVGHVKNAEPGPSRTTGRHKP